MPAGRHWGRRALALAALITSGFLAAAVFAPAAAQTAERCAPCHGPDGNSVTPGIPSIAAQPKVFTENFLILVREGLRGGEAMQQVMKGASDAEITGLAAHFANLPARAAPGETDTALYERGRQVAAKNRCGTCHLPDFRGREQMQRLAGQREEYLYDTMRAYRDSPPPGSDTIMTATLYGVADADIRALAHFLARTK